MRRILIAVLAALSTASATACATGGHASLADAASAVERGSEDGRTLALAGWHAWAIRGDAAAAEKLAARAAKEAPDDPWASFLQAELARRSLDPKAEVDALFRTVERNPQHPLALVAAGRLPLLARGDAKLDAILEKRSARLLDSHPPGELASRLRAVLRIVQLGRGLDAAKSTIADAGLLTAAAVVGPFSDWHGLEFPKAFAPEGRGPVAAKYAGAGGAEYALRPFSLPTGWISLVGEESDGDVYYALSVAEVPAGGRYVARLGTSSPTSATLVVDGVPLVTRNALADSGTVESTAVELSAGTHLVAVKIGRGRGSGEALVSLAPADGSPSKIKYRAAKAGDSAGTPPQKVEDDAVELGTSARALASVLEEEAGIAGVFSAALDAERRDPAEARVLVESALSRAPQAGPLLALHADLIEDDSAFPSRIAAARAAADWDAVLAKDPDSPQALLASARLLAAAGRQNDAQAKLDRAAEVAPKSAPVSMARARLALSRGADANAIRFARAAAAQGGDGCSAARMSWDLARRIDAIGEVDEASEQLAACSDGRQRLAVLQRDRGNLDEAIRLAAELLAESPQDPSAAFRLSDALLAAGKVREAAAVVEEQERYWPRSATLPGRRAELLERAGDAAGAVTARARALSLQGADLQVRRMRAMEAGTDALADLDRDGLEVIRSFRKNEQRFDSPAVILLDFGAVEAYRDGSYLERVHLVAKVLDKRGIDELGEVDLPGGAEVIQLRTVKQDGRILVPETIAGKDSISLPGLEVGDYVEYSYLVAHGSRGAGLPGWSASPFYFRTAGMPMLESTYAVRAEGGLDLDVHNGAEGTAITEKDGWKTVTFRRTDLPALLPEPMSPSRKEFLPWVQVGTGADESRLFPFFADNLAGASRLTPELRRWAKEVASKSSGDALAKVKALYDASMEKVEGSDRSFGVPASQVLTGGRGNRLLLLKAALDSLGIEARYAAVRTFDQDPDSYRFPEPERWGYVVLAVRPDREGGYVWLDPSTRWMPFGMLSPVARDTTAWILPEPGETEARRVSTPDGADAPRGRAVDLKLALAADGSLAGEGVERYLGFEGAVARSALDDMDDDRRRQVVEGSLAGAFRGLTLEDLSVENDAGGVSIRYRFKVPSFARDLGQGRQLVDLDFFAAGLGRRFLARGSRETPLLLAAPERTVIRTEMTLPDGAKLERPIDPAREHGPYGDYRRAVATGGGKIAIDESLDVARNRITPDAYRDFAAWVSAVDRAQAIEAVVAR